MGSHFKNISYASWLNKAKLYTLKEYNLIFSVTFTHQHYFHSDLLFL